ncbi:MAG: hypothetical protein R2754_10670 [Microthrixaceae bacterium]
MFNELQLVASPLTDVFVELGQPLVKIDGVEIVGDDQQIDVRRRRGVSSRHGPEDPGTSDVGPLGEALADSINQLAAESCKGHNRSGRQVPSVQLDQRGPSCRGLDHQPGFDQGSQYSAGVGWCDAGQVGDLPSTDRPFKGSQRLQQPSTHVWRHVEHGRAEVHTAIIVRR